jgi:putative DNA primase/helicase
MSHDALERARSALSYLDYTDRQEWVEMAMAIKDEFGENGFEVWDEWGSKAEGYRANDAKSVWRSAKPGGKMRFGTLIFRAKQAGWKDDSTYQKPSAEELKKREAAAAKRAQEAAEQEAKEHADAAACAVRIWGDATPASEHSYLTKKGIKAHGLRIGTWEVIDGLTGEIVTIPGCLLIPMMDRQRKLHSLQAIEPSGKKRYLRGGAKRGHFHVIGTAPRKHQDKLVFVIVEGYATGASVHECTGHLVLCVFDRSNMNTVAQALRERAPDAIILFAADNDQWNRDKNGNPVNPGVEDANEAAQAVSGMVAVPPFTKADATGTDEKGHAIGPTDWNDWHLAHGAESVAELIDGALTPAAPEQADQAPDEAPWDGDQQPSLPVDPGEDEALLPQSFFTVLGYDGDDYYFFHHEKQQVLKRTRGDFSDIGLVELAELQWWEEHFPNPTGKGGINRVQAFEWIIKLAHARGVYDPRQVRGRGAWRDNGRVVFHHGDYLTVDNDRVPVSGIRSRWVYPVSRSMPPAAEVMLSDEEGRHILETAKMARWSRPASAALLAGWVFLGPVCGALPWRPHIWITGAAGSGKSWLYENFVNNLLSGIGEPFQGDSSEPGIRQVVRADAVPVLIDEFEPNDEKDRQRMKSVLTMIRQASSETAAQTAKGTLSGQGVRFHIRSMFCLASINTMLDKDSDESRITKLVLRPAASGEADNWEQLQERMHEIERDGAWPSRMLARALHLLPTILENVKVFCDAATEKFGTRRMGDQFGTLMAGAWCLCSSKVATPEQAAKAISTYDWTEYIENREVDDPEKALRAIMEAKINQKGESVSVGTLVTIAAGEVVEGLTMEQKVAKRVLVEHGMQISANHLLFENGSLSLQKLISDTSYASDLRGQLLRLPGAKRFEPRRFATGAQSRSVGIPLEMVVSDEPPI